MPGPNRALILATFGIGDSGLVDSAAPGAFARPSRAARRVRPSLRSPTPASRRSQTPLKHVDPPNIQSTSYEKAFPTKRAAHAVPLSRHRA